MKLAFSLVELSIVLVILGLLTGGILAGKSLIRASELRAVTTEYNRYVTAANSFRDKYFYLPGDMLNASAVWGPFDGGDGTGSDCRGESSSKTTCNGDGNGRIEYGATGASLTYENAWLWQHLANAGLIEGTYTGNPANRPGNTMCVSAYQNLGGCNMPASKLAGALWIAQYFGTLSGDTNRFDGAYGNVLQLNLSPANAGLNPALKAEELWNIDTKLDDGLPASGKVFAGRWLQCATGATGVSDGAHAVYNVNSTSMVCEAIFRNVF
jgi:prepilin-type N-terminal cleavage/methylation domain-containing protein